MIESKLFSYHKKYNRHNVSEEQLNEKTKENTIVILVYIISHTSLENALIARV